MSRIHFISSGSGRPIVLLHGFCETHEIWDSWLQKITTTSRIYSIDLPGFGKSPLPRQDFTLDDIASEIIDWIKSEGLELPILVGHSLGGYIGLSMLSAAPLLFSGLVLFHSTAMPDSKEKQLNRLKTIEFVKKNGIQAFIDSFVPNLFFDSDHISVSKALQIASSTSIETFIAYSLAMRRRFSSEEVLRNSRIPILLLAGENDPVLPLESLLNQRQLNEQIDFHKLKKTAHMGFFESESESAEVVQKFILRV